GIQSGRLGAAGAGADIARGRPIGVRRAARREQTDQRALFVDGLVIILQKEVVELAALEVDRALEARRVDGDARIRLERLGDRFGRGHAERRGAAGRGDARLLRLGGLRRLFGRDVRLGLALRLRLVLALVGRPGVEILPPGHHQDRQGYSEKEVSRVLGVHGRLSLPFAAVCAAGRLVSLALRLTARKAWPTSSTSAAKERPSASRRAIST